MSGKAPPTGPRALLGTQSHQPSSSPASSSHNSQHSPPSQPPRGPRGQASVLATSLSKPIPTGPRSLLATASPANQPPPKHPPKPHLNGATGLQSNRQPVSFKGKQPEKAPVSTGHSGNSINGRSESLSTNGDSSESVAHADISSGAKGEPANLDNGSSSLGNKSMGHIVSTSISASNDRATISIAIPISVSSTKSKEKLAKPASPFANSAPSQEPTSRPPSVPPPPPPPPKEEPPPPPPPSLPPPPVPPVPSSIEQGPERQPPPPSSVLPPPPPSSSPPPPPPSQPFSQPPPPSLSAGPSSSSVQSLSMPLPKPAKLLIPLSHHSHFPPTSQPSTSKAILPSRPSSSLAVPSHQPTPTPSPVPQKREPLPSAPDWPPPQSAYPPRSEARTHKVLYDPSVDTFSNAAAINSTNAGKQASKLQLKKDPSYYKALIEHVRKCASPDVASERIKGKGKGKEILIRYDGEVVGGGDVDVDGQGRAVTEEEIVVSDPRKVEPGKSIIAQKYARDKLFQIEYEYDSGTTVGSPPTSVLITNIPPLTSVATLRNYYRTFGPIVSLEWQVDRSNGAPLGVLYLQYQTAEEAKRCLSTEDGRIAGYGVGVAKGPSGPGRPGQDEAKLRAVLDGDGRILKAVMKLIEERKSWDKEQKRRKEQGLPPLPSSQSLAPPPSKGGLPNGTDAHTPDPTHPQPGKPAPHHRAPPTTGSTPATPLPTHQDPAKATEADLVTLAYPVPSTRSTLSSLPKKPQMPTVPASVAAAPPSLLRARATVMATAMMSQSPQSQLPTPSQELSATPMGKGTPSQLPPKPLVPLPPSTSSTARNRPPPGMYKSSYRPVLDRDRFSRSPSPYSPYSARGRDKERERDWDTWRASDDDRGRVRDRSREWRRESWTSRGRDTYRGQRSWSRSRSRSLGERERGRSFERERSWERERSRERVKGRDYRDWRDRDRGREKEKDVQEKAAEKEKHENIMEELAKNGKEHARLPLVSSSIQEDDVKQFFNGFNVEKIFKDQLGWYITFLNADAARRAATVLSNHKNLGFQPVTITTHPPPAPPKTRILDEDELVAEARQIIVRDLKAALEKDIRDQVVEPEIRDLIIKEKENMMRVGAGSGISALGEKRGLKGLSFKKQRKTIVEEVQLETLEVDERKDEVDEEEVPEPPKKKRKKEVPKKASRRVIDEDVESEEDVEADAVPTPETVRKRGPSEEQYDADEPAKKKHRAEVEAVEVKTKKAVAKKKTKKSTKKAVETVEDVIYPSDVEFEAPFVADVCVTPSEFSPLPSPVPERKRKPPRPATPPPTPPPNPFDLGLCDDDEDLYFLKLAMQGWEPPEPEERVTTPSVSEAPAFRKHITGSARTEGFYKITHAEKSAYVAQYQARAATSVEAVPTMEEPQQIITSSRSNRANARRRAQGLEEMNQIQKAITLSKGENAVNELTFKFNQLQTRKKHLRFARSPIHDWGLYAMEKIMRGEMVIEYVGEIIRAQVADKREKAYERQGIGSSYLFRIDEDLVVDATKKGNLGRLINHSCDPNCTAKIITINGEKKIVIYAKQDIELGDEITYDYHFPFEQDKIPCLCGSAKCRGFLN